MRGSERCCFIAASVGVVASASPTYPDMRISCVRPARQTSIARHRDRSIAAREQSSVEQRGLPSLEEGGPQRSCGQLINPDTSRAGGAEEERTTAVNAQTLRSASELDALLSIADSPQDQRFGGPVM